MLCNNWLFSQDTIFLDKARKETLNAKEAFYFKLVRVDTINLKTIERIYFISGKTNSEKTYSDYEAKILDGISKEWNEDGILKITMEFKLNKCNGEFTSYWQNGTVKRIDNFQNDSLIKGICFDINGNEIDYFVDLKSPQFPGGKSKLSNFLSQELIYPESALKNEISGIVIVNFSVNIDGSIYKIEIVQSINEDLDSEALRVIKKMPNWIPGSFDGFPVIGQYTLPIKFSL